MPEPTIIEMRAYKFGMKSRKVTVERKNVSEGQIVKECKEWLEANGCFVWRNNTGKRGSVSYGLKGSADLIGMNRSGRFIAIECKAIRGVLSLEQREFKSRVEEKNGLYILAYGIEQLEARKAEFS